MNLDNIPAQLHARLLEVEKILNEKDLHFNNRSNQWGLHIEITNKSGFCIWGYLQFVAGDGECLKKGYRLRYNPKGIDIQGLTGPKLIELVQSI